MSRPFGCSKFQGLFKSSGGIDRLGLAFIDLYVLELKSRLHCSKAALRFGENKTLYVPLLRKYRYRRRTEQDTLRAAAASFMYVYTVHNWARTGP